MQTTSQTSDNIKKIEDLLDKVFENLSEISEDNFDQKLQDAKSKMELAIEIKDENYSKTEDFKPSKKIIDKAKLISDKYDNVIKDWANKLKTVQKEIELAQNQKKITIYNR